MTRDEITVAIEGITEQMKGPLSDVERQLLHLDRKDLRRELDRILQAATPEGNK